jgi:tetratricopeptide (TPR) repeat protein
LQFYLFDVMSSRTLDPHALAPADALHRLLLWAMAAMLLLLATRLWRAPTAPEVAQSGSAQPAVLRTRTALRRRDFVWIALMIASCAWAFYYQFLSATSYYVRASDCHWRGEDALAVKYYTRAIELNPRFADAYTNRGNADLALGNKDLALQDYARAIMLKPQDIQAYINRAFIFQSEAKYDLAILECDKAIEADPRDSRTYYVRAVLHYRKREFAQAWADVDRCRQAGGEVKQEFLAELNRVAPKGR